MDKKGQLIDLWRLCFGDSEDFIRLFFDRVYREENALTLEREGRILCALHIVPYRMLVAGHEWSLAYVCGVATWPEYRRRGLMGQLMRQAIDVMAGRGYDLTALIPATPALFEYYRTFGYQEFFNYSLTRFVASGKGLEKRIRVVRAPFEEWGTTYRYFDRKIRERLASVVYGQDQFETLLLDHMESGGDLFLAYRDDKPEQLVGLAFGLPDDGGDYRVKELVVDSIEAREALLGFVAEDKGVHSLLVRELPTLGKPVCLYGMARPLRDGLGLEDVRGVAYMNLMLD